MRNGVRGKRMSRQRVLEELSVLSALLFAGSLYSPDVRIPLSFLSNPPVNALRSELKILNMII
jgi:hypothetical protein